MSGKNQYDGFPKSVRIIGMKCHVITDHGLLGNYVSQLSVPNNYVCVSNVHMAVESRFSPHFANVLEGAGLVLPDGKPLSVCQRLLGNRPSLQVRGEDLLRVLLRGAEERGYKVGFYGGNDMFVLEDLKAELKRVYPNLEIPFLYSPPFRPLSPDEDDEVVMAINAARLDYLFVGLGCPKQENWMYEHRGSVSATMFGVGAVFDFISGNKKTCPKYLQGVGLEWLYRLCMEPRRLWKRYARTIPIFLFLFFWQIIKGSK